MACVLTSFKLLLNCHLFREFLPTFPHQSPTPFHALFFFIILTATWYICVYILACYLSPFIRILTPQQQAFYLFCLLLYFHVHNEYRKRWQWTSFVLVSHNEPNKAWSKLAYFHVLVKISFFILVLLIQSQACIYLWIRMALVLVQEIQL